MTAMIEESIRGTARRFADALSDHERPLDQLNAFFTATRDIAREWTPDTIAVLLALAEARRDAPEIADAIMDARSRAWRFAAGEFCDRFGVEDGMLFAHLQFAFTSYMTHVVQSSKNKDDARAIFDSYRRVMLITAAALRPDLAHDPAFAAALADASRQRSTVPDTDDVQETDHD